MHLTFTYAGAAIALVCGGLLLFAWMAHPKDRAGRARPDRIQPG